MNEDVQVENLQMLDLHNIWIKYFKIYHKLLFLALKVCFTYLGI